MNRETFLRITDTEYAEDLAIRTHAEYGGDLDRIRVGVYRGLLKIIGHEVENLYGLEESFELPTAFREGDEVIVTAIEGLGHDIPAIVQVVTSPVDHLPYLIAYHDEREEDGNGVSWVAAEDLYV